MRGNREGDRAHSRVAPIHLLAAAAILGLLIMPVAFAEDGNPGATKSAKVAKQLKKVKKRLAALEARPDQVGQVPASLPPSGPAGGDLTGNYPSPLIGPGAVDRSELVDDAVDETKIAPSEVNGLHVADNSLDDNDIFEPALLIPAAWAVVSDPGGNSQPAGDPRALTSEGVSNINDGDGGDDDDMVGLHCYELGFTPDLILATARGEDTIVTGPQQPVGDCGTSADDAQLSIESRGTGNFTDGGVHVAFFDLE